MKAYIIQNNSRSGQRSHQVKEGQRFRNLVNRITIECECVYTGFVVLSM